MGQSPDGNSYNSEGNGMVFYQGCTDFGVWNPNIRLYTTEPKRMANAHDILLSVRAPVGDVNFADTKCCLGRGLAGINSIDYIDFIYYAFLANADEFNVYNVSGTVFGSINKDKLADFPVPYPNAEIMKQFLSIASPLNAQNHHLSAEIKLLTKLKQLFLSKFFG